MAFLTAFVRGAAIVMATLAVSAGYGWTDSPELTEAQAKAALLYNFANFVEWPVGGKKLVIAVAGDTEVYGALRGVTGKQINGREIVVRNLTDSDDPAQCGVLYLPAVREQASAAHLRRIGKAPVLTISDSATFMRDGGVVRIFFEGARLRFEVNLANADRARLRISSKVLGLARRVHTDGQHD